MSANYHSARCSVCYTRRYPQHEAQRCCADEKAARRERIRVIALATKLGSANPLPKTCSACGRQHKHEQWALECCSSVKGQL